MGPYLTIKNVCVPPVHIMYYRGWPIEKGGGGVALLKPQ